MISDLFPLLLGILISFACGYGVRELMSRRRRDAIRKNTIMIIQKSDGTIYRIFTLMVDGPPNGIDVPRWWLSKTTSDGSLPWETLQQSVSILQRTSSDSCGRHSGQRGDVS